MIADRERRVDALERRATPGDTGTNDMASLGKRFEGLLSKGDDRTEAETDRMAELYLEILEARDDPLPGSGTSGNGDGDRGDVGE